MESDAKKMVSDNKGAERSVFEVVSILLMIIFMSVGWTAVPLFTIDAIGLDISVFIMLMGEFITAICAYQFFLKKRPGINFCFHQQTGIMLFFAGAVVVILLLQISAFALSNVQDNGGEQERLTWVSMFTLIFIVPIYEEIYYRGCVIELIRLVFTKSMLIPVVLSSIFFCFMHTQYNDYISYFVLFASSLLIGYTRFKTNGLFYPVLLHSMMNTIAIFLMSMHSAS